MSGTFSAIRPLNSHIDIPLIDPIIRTIKCNLLVDGQQINAFLRLMIGLKQSFPFAVRLPEFLETLLLLGFVFGSWGSHWNADGDFALSEVAAAFGFLLVECFVSAMYKRCSRFNEKVQL